MKRFIKVCSVVMSLAMSLIVWVGPAWGVSPQRAERPARHQPTQNDRASSPTRATEFYRWQRGIPCKKHVVEGWRCKAFRPFQLVNAATRAPPALPHLPRPDDLRAT